MRIGNVEAKVLLALSDSARGLHVFTIYKRLKFPLGDVIRAILKLQELGLLALNEDEHATLTSDGKQSAYSVASSERSRSAKPWRDVPDRFKKQPEKNDLDLYIPDMTLLHKNFFC